MTGDVKRRGAPVVTKFENGSRIDAEPRPAPATLPSASILGVSDGILGEAIVSYAPAGHSVTAPSVDQAAPVSGGVDQSRVRMNRLLAPEPHHVALVDIPV